MTIITDHKTPEQIIRKYLAKQAAAERQAAEEAQRLADEERQRRVAASGSARRDPSIAQPPATATAVGDFLRLENIVCTDADDQVFEQYPELYVRKDVFKDAAGNIVYSTAYDGAAHAEQQGCFAPSMALSCTMLAALFQAVVEKQTAGTYRTKDAALEQVLLQFKNKSNGSDGHRQNTLVNWGTQQIIHYPTNSDFLSNGGTQNINTIRPRTALGFNRKGLSNMDLEEALRHKNVARYVKNLTGLSDPSVLVEIGQYFGLTAQVLVSSDDETRTVWLGCDSKNFNLIADFGTSLTGVVRGVRSSAPLGAP